MRGARGRRLAAEWSGRITLEPAAGPLGEKPEKPASPSQHPIAPTTTTTATQAATTRLILHRPLKMPRGCWWWLTTVALATLLQATSGQQQQQPQYFEVQPEAQVLASQGHDVRLRCLVRNRQGECLWLRNGRAIGATLQRKYQFLRQPEDGDCSLTVRNASVTQDDGVWQCQVTPADVEQETLQSRETLLQVLVAPERPQIRNTSQWQNTQRLVVEENKGRIVVCEVRGGNPAPQIEWMLEGRNVTKEAQLSFSGAPGQPRITQSRLRLSDIRRSMNGRNLTCLGLHPSLNQSVWAELDVQYVPTVSVVQREYSVVEGSPLSIACQVDANPPPNAVSWRLVGAGEGAAAAAGRQLSRQGPVLEFERISRDLNQNTFQCSAQNAYGLSLPANVKLNVLYAPFLLNTSHSESVPLGSDAQLACIFDGNPEPEVKWHYTDPLARSAQPVQVANDRQQLLAIKNVTYRNEGDYHCEARNQINGVNYAVRSSNILLDVFGEPQFLSRSPAHLKALQGARAELTLSFCADPAPTKVYWQFGSLRLDVRLAPTLVGSEPPPGGQRLSNGGPAISQRYLAHPLQPLQRRPSSFSKISTCFEAQLHILGAELTDQRDYTLVVHNERGHQSAVARLRVSSPLSPVLMISSAFVTICGLFLCSLVAMFLMKRRHDERPDEGCLTGSEQRLEKQPPAAHNMEHSIGNNQQQQQQQQQLTRGIINGIGNGMANQSSNPAAMNGGPQEPHHTPGGAASPLKSHHLMSMGSSDCSSSGDQKQLLTGNSSASSTTGNHQFTAASSPTDTGSPRSSRPLSTPSPMNHISVDDDVSSSTYRAGDQVQLDARQDAELAQHRPGALIYANLDYAPDFRSQQLALDGHQFRAPLHSPLPSDSRHSSLTSADSMSSIRVISSSRAPQASGADSLLKQPQGNMRSSVGATIALMNSLAAQAANQSMGLAQAGAAQGPTSGALSQHLANNNAANNNNNTARLVRKAGPPKPPKPNIQQRARLYPLQAGIDNQGLVVMEGGPANTAAAASSRYQESMASLDSEEPSANELAVEYSRIAFSARAEL